MNQTQKALLLRAKEAHDAAQLLLEHRLYRDATSRAYYCMFYVAQAFLEERGMSFSSHKATIASFGRHVAKAGIVPTELHGHLVKAQDARHEGDYLVTANLGLTDAKVMLERAGRFLMVAEEKL